MASAKERQAKRRARIRENPELYKAHLEKDRKRKRLELRSTKAKMSNSEREEFLLKERIRIRKLRADKKSAQHVGECSTSGSTPYRSTQSLGKAMKRARTSLPKSPRKQRCVVSKLAESMGLNVSTNSSFSTPCHGSVLSTDTKKCVVELYNNSDTSWQAPGRKDQVIIREMVAGERLKTTGILRGYGNYAVL